MDEKMNLTPEKKLCNPAGVMANSITGIASPKEPEADNAYLFSGVFLCPDGIALYLGGRTGSLLARRFPLVTVLQPVWFALFCLQAGKSEETSHQRSNAMHNTTRVSNVFQIHQNRPTIHNPRINRCQLKLYKLSGLKPKLRSCNEIYSIERRMS